jgi:hypothetical protein
LNLICWDPVLINIAETPTEPRDTNAPVSSASNTPDASQELLRAQLAGSRATVQRSKEIIKTKDDQLAKSKEEINQLSFELAESKASAQATRPPRQDSGNPVVVSLNKLVTEQDQELGKQKRQIADLESCIAKMKACPKTTTISTLPPKPQSRDIGTDVLALQQTIEDLMGKNDRHMDQIRNLERKNASLKGNTVAASATRLGGREQGTSVEYRINRTGQEKQRGDTKPTWEEKPKEVSGQVQRQLPPHLIENEVKNPRSNAIQSVGSNDSQLRSSASPAAGDSKIDGGLAGSSTGTQRGSSDHTSQSQTGPDNLAAKGRSLWDRMGKKQVEQRPIMRIGLKQGGREPERQQGRTRGIAQNSGEGGWSGSLAQNEWTHVDHDKAGWGSDFPGDGWRDADSGEHGRRYTEADGERWSPGEPSEGEWSYRQPRNDQHGFDNGGDHWNPYYSQSAHYD